MATKKGTNEKRFDLDGSYARAFAQRAVLAGFLLNELGAKFVQQDACRKVIAPKVYATIGKGKWNRAESLAKLQTDAGRYFSEWFRFERSAQASTLQEFIRSSTRLTYLDGMEDLDKASPFASSHSNSLVRLALAIHALEMSREPSGPSVYEMKRKLAEQVLLAISRAWQPDGLSIELAAFPIGGWGKWKPAKKPGAGAGFREMKIYQDRLAFEVSEEVARRWQPSADINALDFLLMLASDERPLPIGASLRWGLDVLAAIVAAHCLVVCEAVPDSSAKRGVRKETLSFELEGLEGLMQSFCYRPDAIDPKNQLRVFERLHLGESEDRDGRAFWFLDTLAHSVRLVCQVCDMLTPGTRVIVEVWGKTKLDLPPVVPTRMAAPIEAALAAAERSADPAEKIEIYFAALERSAPLGVQEAATPIYGSTASTPFHSEAWRERIGAIFAKRDTLGRRLYALAEKESRGPSREDYLEILRLADEIPAEIRSTTPGISLKDIRNAHLRSNASRRRRSTQ